MTENEENITARCMDMCPRIECSKRQQQNLIHILETDSHTPGKHNLQANQKKMIKSYCRSAAGHNLCKPELLRPPHILRKTVDYIINELMLDERISKSAVYDFINDRFRSVKQDGVIQRMTVEDWFQILLPVTRFYAFSAYWLCEEKLQCFDPKLNRSQLLDCLLLLIKNFEQNPNHKYAIEYAEMEALYLIVDPSPETINRAIMLNLSDPVFQSTLKLILKWFTGNYYAVLQKLGELPLLPACLFAALHLTALKKHTIQTMSFAYCCKNNRYPCTKMVSDLWFNSVEEVIAELLFYGVTESVQGDDVQFKKTILSSNYAPCKRSKILDNQLKEISLQDLLINSRTK